MQHAVIFAHPKADSLTATIARTYAEAGRALGHEVIVRDLYRVGFDPCLKAQEIPTEEGYREGADVLAERKLIEHAEVFAFIYPFWFNAPPAMLKGYVDRVFCTGFGYEPGAGGVLPLLVGRRIISFTTSGAPDHWVRQTHALEYVQLGFDMHVAAVCGMTVAGHLHFGGIASNIRDDVVDDLLDQVRQTVRRTFAGSDAVPA